MMNYKSRFLGGTPPAPTTTGVPTLLTLALDAVARNFVSNPSLAGIPPALLVSLSSRLPANLDPCLTMPLIADEHYWRRACEEGRGWVAVDIRHHGGSWRQAFAELFVSESLRQFGVYPRQPPGWDLEFVRPPMDSRHALWGSSHPSGPLERPDMWPGKNEDGRRVPWRERYCRNATENRACDTCHVQAVWHPRSPSPHSSVQTRWLQSSHYPFCPAPFFFLSFPLSALHLKHPSASASATAAQSDGFFCSGP